MKIRLRMTAVLLAVCLAMGGCGTKEDDPHRNFQIIGMNCDKTGYSTSIENVWRVE